MNIGGFLRNVATALSYPHYACQPWHIVERLMQGAPPSAEQVDVELPWGHILSVSPKTHIGHILWEHTLYDHTVSEALWRLSVPGACHVDVGAHIGYTTSLLAHRAGPTGIVHAVEPHPVLNKALRANVSRIEQSVTTDIVIHPVALSSHSGVEEIGWDEAFETNRGTASLEKRNARHRTPVQCMRLDDLLPDARIEVVKIDVEGHEGAVLKGATQTLAEQRIRHIVYESHADAQPSCHAILSEAGYSLFQLGWRSFRPVLWPIGADATGHIPSSPVFLATQAPAVVQQRYRAWGWHCLSGNDRTGMA